MSVLTLYILRQILTPLLIATFTLSGIIWLLRALRALDVVVISGQGLSVWLELLLYTMPRVLETTLPPSFLIAVFYAFYRLFMDREIIIMFSTGVSRARLMRPVLFLALAIATLVMALGFVVAPWTNQLAKQRSLEINSDIANAMLRPGIFTNPTRGVTAFIRTRNEKGFLYGIFFQDARDPQKPVSYTAESGALIYEKSGTRLVMFDGHVQYIDKTSTRGGVTLVKFDRYSYNLSQLVKLSSSTFISGRELFPHQLYERWQNNKTPVAEKKDMFLFANNLALKAFYIIAYSLIALAVFLPAQINRQGYRKRIIFASATALALSVSHFPLLSIAFTNSFYFAWLYINPIIVSALAAFICLRGVGFIARIKHRAASKAREKQLRAKRVMPV